MRARLSIRWAGIVRAARPVRLATALAAVAVLAAPAEAARLSDVRVGSHPGFTRVVLELDGPAGYWLEEPKRGEAPELLLELDARAVAHKLVSKSPLVRSVRIEPSTRGSTVRIGLATDRVHVTEMILARPSRIVLDVRRLDQPTGAKQPVAPVKAPKARAAAAPPKAPAKSAPVAKAAPKEAAAAPPRPVAPEAAAASGSGGEQPTEAPPEAAPAGTTEAAPALEDNLVELKPEVLEKAAAAAMGEPVAALPVDPEVEGETELAPETAAGEAIAEAGELSDTDELAVAELEVAAPAPTLAEEPEPVPVAPPAEKTFGAAEPAPAPAQRAARRAWIPEWLSGSRQLVALAAGLVLILIVAWMRVRRRESEALTSALPEEEELTATGFAESVAAEADAVPQPAPAEASEGLASPFQPGPEEAPPEAETTEHELPLEPALKASAAPDFEPAPALGQAAAAEGDVEIQRQVLELEQRIAHLEKRLEEGVEARERLERQVGAQTEELRVQRAAIARTQRVVRSMTRPEEAATEPVPRPPGRPGN